MARRSRSPNASKKHIARAERERRLRRILIFGTAGILALALGLILYGVILNSFINPSQPAAQVNGEEISTEAFQKRVRYQRQTLVNQYINAFQTTQQFGGDPSIMQFLGSSFTQIESQLDDTALLGQQVMDSMIDEVLIRQEAEAMGITVSDGELDRSIEVAFGYFPGGTPTPPASPEPLATSTLTALQRELVTPIPQPEEGSQLPGPAGTPTVEDGQVTVTPTAIPPTATPYTREAYEQNLQLAVENVSLETGFGMEDFRNLFRTQLLQERIFDILTADTESIQEQVWARHILVDTEETAQEVLSRLEEGDDWSELAAEYSTDQSNRDLGGDLGWFARGRMVPEFETAAFSLDIGEISDPVQTTFGWHIIQVIGHETRPLDTTTLENLKQQAFNDWLAGVRENAAIVIADDLGSRTPIDPDIPFQVRATVQQLLSQPVQQPPFPTEGAATPEAAPTSAE